VEEEGRPAKGGCLHRSVEIARMCLRQNIAEEALGGLWGVSQSARLADPDRAGARGEGGPRGARAGREGGDRGGQRTSAPGRRRHHPCWSYDAQPELWSRKHGTTGFNARLVSLLDGGAAHVSDPLPGKTHDARAAFADTPVAEIVKHSGGGIGDKGHQGCEGMATPRKTPPGGELSKNDKKRNAERPYHTYRDAYDATRGLFFFSITWGFE
jgi:hypothetical protein